MNEEKLRAELEKIFYEMWKHLDAASLVALLAALARLEKELLLGTLQERCRE